ncbi:nuclease-related domain-containing protein [Piscibacillus halophilus]|uniref:nuclease-related domain-containing protein n=1 Tax=Piscibacillus halophilus TaxID=571933 RepID=UPI002409259A|nr:nuclease-related domain-containing protein [Piscibacillus halophilus]
MVPIKVLRTIAFKHNINPSHMSYPIMTQDLNKYMAGMKGERSIHFFLYPIIHKNYTPFYNARLYAFGQHFEIDVLLITNQFILILEVKNLLGRIRFDHQSGGMIQIKDDVETLYQDPIIQVERHKTLLQKWLSDRGYQVPIETLVCFVNRNVILDRETHTDPRIIYGYKLAQKYEELVEQYYNHSYVLLKEKLYNLINSENQPLDITLMKKYGLNEHDFKPGILCLNCLSKTMVRNRHIWKCQNCHSEDAEALLRGLKDYFLIFGSNITNEKARSWLKESDRHYIKKILDRLSADKTGTRKSTNYILDFNYEEDYNYLLKLLNSS